jgi:hypothetical protein
VGDKKRTEARESARQMGRQYFEEMRLSRRNGWELYKLPFVWEFISNIANNPHIFNCRFSELAVEAALDAAFEWLESWDCPRYSKFMRGQLSRDEEYTMFVLANEKDVEQWPPDLKARYFELKTQYEVSKAQAMAELELSEEEIEIPEEDDFVVDRINEQMLAEGPRLTTRRSNRHQSQRSERWSGNSAFRVLFCFKWLQILFSSR